MQFSITEERMALSLVAMLLITVMTLLGVHWPALAAVHTPFVGGIVSCLGLFMGSAVGNRFIDTKFGQTVDTNVNEGPNMITPVIAPVMAAPIIQQLPPQDNPRT